MAASVRGRAGQGSRCHRQVGQGVVDSSFGALRALLPGQSQTTDYGGGAGAASGSLFAVPG